MNGKDIKVIIKTAVSLFLICAVAAGILAGVNSITSTKIAENAANAATEARKAVQPDAEDFLMIDENDETKGYKAVDVDGIVIGYVFTTSASSYGGPVEVMTGITEGGVITGIQILSIDDTPGLGMNAKKDTWYGQFACVDTSAGELAVNKDGGTIEAIASATITSRAVTKAVNEAVALYNEVKEAGNNG